MSRMSIDNPLRVRRTAQVYQIHGNAKVGGTAGWVLGAATNVGRFATIPAGVTAGTLVVALPFVKVGWAINAFYLLGQIESAGNAATLDCNLRKVTAAAADLADASVASMTQISVTADTLVNVANSRKELTAPEYLSAMNSYYFLITATTAASTDIDLLSVCVDFIER